MTNDIIPFVAHSISELLVNVGVPEKWKGVIAFISGILVAFLYIPDAIYNPLSTIASGLVYGLAAAGLGYASNSIGNNLPTVVKSTPEVPKSIITS